MTKKERAAAVTELLKSVYPEAVCALHYTHDYELLFATRLSAHNAEDNLRADGRRLDRTAPAVQLVVGVPACGDVAVHLVERRRDDVGQLNLFRCWECRQRSAPRK